MRVCNNHKGFSLIELSIVLVIIGLLVGLGSSMIGPMTSYVKVRETRDMEDANLQSVISWASSNNMLPHASTDAADVSGFRYVAKSYQDAWNQDFIYLYDGSLSPATTPTKDTICGRRATLLSLALDATTTKKNIAFALFSRADNDTLQSKKNSDNSTPASGAVTVADTIKIYTTNGKNPDIVRWVTLDELRSKIGCQGAPLKIVNNELPSGKAASTGYSATLTADGGVPPYKWCVERPATSPFVTTNSITLSAPDSCNDPTGSSWNSYPLAINNETLSATPGSYKLNVYVRDTADGTGTSTKKCDAADLDYNCAKKTFVLTVSPQQ